MNIGLFGGTFDPPHWAHLILAEYVRDEIGLDRVWLLPALVPPHKAKHTITPAELRLEMTKLLCDDDRLIIASDADMTHKRQPSYTIDLLDELSKKSAGDKYFLIIGADSLVEFTTWHRWKEILMRYTVLSLPRPNTDISSAHPDVVSAVKMLNAPLIEISSTEIRNRIAEGRSIKYMTTEKVRLFIENNNLYR